MSCSNGGLEQEDPLGCYQMIICLLSIIIRVLVARTGQAGQIKISELPGHLLIAVASVTACSCQPGGRSSVLTQHRALYVIAGSEVTDC